MNSSKGSSKPVTPPGEFPWDSNKFENDGPLKYNQARTLEYLTEKMGMGNPCEGAGIDSDGNFDYNGTNEPEAGTPWLNLPGYTPQKHTTNADPEAGK